MPNVMGAAVEGQTEFVCETKSPKGQVCIPSFLYPGPGLEGSGLAE